MLALFGIGKGDKERLVPIGQEAIKQINIYKHSIRVTSTGAAGIWRHTVFKLPWKKP